MRGLYLIEGIQNAGLVCHDSLQGSDMASRDRPLDFQVPPAEDRDADLLSPSPTLFFCVWASFWETLPLVRLDKEVQVKVVHALLDVVPVGSNQFLVVVDLRLWCSNKTVNKTGRKGRDKRKRRPKLYLAEEVADDGVGHGVGQAAELREETTEQAPSRHHFSNLGLYLNVRGERYLVCSPVHPSLSTRVDVDEQQALDHVRIIQLQQQNQETWDGVTCIYSF